MPNPKRIGDKPARKKRQPWIARFQEPKLPCEAALEIPSQSIAAPNKEPTTTDHSTDHISPPRDATPAIRVFTIFELTERILDSDILDTKQLFVLQRVNDCFLGAITRSPALRTKMLMQATGRKAVVTSKPAVQISGQPIAQPLAELPDLSLNPFLTLNPSPLSLFKWLQPRFCPGPTDSDSCPSPLPTPELRCQHTKPRSYDAAKRAFLDESPTAPWQGMWITQSGEKLHVRCMFPSFVGSWGSSNFVCVFAFTLEAGSTLGELAGRLREQCEKHEGRGEWAVMTGRKGKRVWVGDAWDQSDLELRSEIDTHWK